MVRSGVGKPNILFGWPKLTYNIARQVSICKLTNTANYFLEVIFAFGEIFFNQRVLLQLDLHWRQPQTSMTNATNLRTFCFKDHRYESFFLSRDSLSGATHSLDLCVLFKFIFLYLRIHSAPFLRFSSVLLTPIFSYVYYHVEYFSYP